MKIFYVALMMLSTLMLGFFVGASEYKNLFSDIKWTDVASLLLTFLGFSLAFYTYQQWLNDKKKEDSYLAAKKYLAAIDRVQDCLHEFYFNYGSMCPSPGVVVLSKEAYAKIIEHVNNVWNELYQAKVAILNSKRELAFWNVSLTMDFDEKHREFIKELDSISVITSCLNNQLYHFLLKDADNMQEVMSEKKVFDEKISTLYQIIEHKTDIGFEKIFSF